MSVNTDSQSRVVKANIVPFGFRNDGSMDDLAHKLIRHNRKGERMTFGQAMMHVRNGLEELGVFVMREKDRDVLCASITLYDSYEALKTTIQNYWKDLTDQELRLDSHHDNLDNFDDIYSR